MRSRISPSSVLTLGLCLASLAFALWAAQATALESGPLHDHAQDVLAETPVQQAMESRVASAIALNVAPGAVADPDVIATVAAGTLEQPAFVTAFADALDRVQARVVRGVEGPILLDPARVAQAVSAAGAGDAQLATGARLVVSVPEDEVPDLAQWADAWRAAVRVLAFFAVLLITYGLLKIEHRIWAVGRIGRWAIAVGIGTLVLFWVVPRILLRPLGGWIAVGGAVAGAGDVLVPISLALVGIGVVVVLAAHRWEAQDRQRMLSVIPHAPTRSTSGSSSWDSPA